MKWFSLRGIKTEIERVRWPKPEELLSNTGTVIGFTAAFALFFLLCDTFSATFLKLIGA